MNKSNSIESNSLETIDKTVLSEQTKFWLSEIIGIENYFYQRKSCSIKLNKYVTTFDCIDKILIVLSATSSGVSIISFTSIVGAPDGIASASLTLIFSLKTGIVKKLLNIIRKKRKNMIKFLCWLKVNSISRALIDLDISHAEFIRILKEKYKYEKMKKNLRSENEEYKIMILSSVKWKT